MKLLILLLIICNTVFAMVREDYLEVKGRVYVYDDKYVCLQTYHELGTIVPRDEVTDEEIKSTYPVSIFIEVSRYFGMIKELKENINNSTYQSCKRL